MLNTEVVCYRNTWRLRRASILIMPSHSIGRGGKGKSTYPEGIYQSKQKF